jgi:TonB-linked SusC/RagA family outer membrane protein
MKKLALFIMALCVCFSAIAQARVQVSGVVSDPSGAPIVGVSVVVKDRAGLGVITDIEGRYTIRAEAFGILVFSYIGMKSHEYQLKDGDETVNVSMELSEDNVLDDVVVTATGIERRVSVTGAVSSVATKDIKVPVSSVSNALAGNVPGLMAMQRSGQPGENTSEFWIRGISTFGGSSAAMVLVDGFERSLDELNIEDIESFSVLKDASATAIYGSRGANGVILITTKRGVEGKVDVNAKVEYSYSTRTMTPDFVDGVTYAEMANEARTTRNQRAAFSDYEMRMLREGLDPDIYPNVNWKELLLKRGAPTYRASVNVRGGGSTARYYLSGSYLNEGGMYKTDRSMNDYNTNSDYTRYNYRLNLDLNITKTTKVSVGIGGSLEKKDHSGFSESQIWDALFGYNPVAVPVMYSNGYAPVQNALTLENYEGSGEIKLYIPNVWVTATQTGYSQSWTNKIESNITLDQDLKFITDGLKFTTRFAFDTHNENIIRRRKLPELWTAERDRDGNGNVVYNRVASEILMFQTSEASGNRKDFLEAELNYSKNFGDHTLGGVVKYTQDNFVNTANVGDDVLQGIAKRHQGLAGNVKYQYGNRYFADFNFGYNGSENFAKGHQFGFFPAFSVAWNIADEAFLRNRQWLNMFKVRFSWGRVGTDNTVDTNRGLLRFPYLASFGKINYDGYYAAQPDAVSYNWADIGATNGYNGLTYTAISSNNVTWEVATKRDIGLDVVMFRRNLEFTVDYFDENRSGIFLRRNFLSNMVGIQAGTPAANVGEVRSKGVDGNFRFTQKAGQVSLTLRGNMTYSRNEIIEADELVNRYPYMRQTGYRVDQARGLIALGLFKDWDDIRNSPRQDLGSSQMSIMPGDIKYKDVNGDGIVNDNDVVPIGATTRPNLVYGIGLAVAWRGFDVNVHFQGAGKSNFFIDGKTVWPFSDPTPGWGSIQKGVADRSDRWILGENEDPNALYPRLSYGGHPNNYRQSTFWMRNGSYLRLKTLEFGYTLPERLTNKAYLKNARFYIIGQNILTFSSFKLWDPEMGSSNGEKYPLSKTWTFGVTFNL